MQDEVTQLKARVAELEAERESMAARIASLETENARLTLQVAASPSSSAPEQASARATDGDTPAQFMDESDCEPDSTEPAAPSSDEEQLNLAELAARATELYELCHTPETGPLVADRTTKSGVAMPRTFVARELVSVLVKSGVAATRAQAVTLGRRLQSRSLIWHPASHNTVTFRDRTLLFRFAVDATETDEQHKAHDQPKQQQQQEQQQEHEQEQEHEQQAAAASEHASSLTQRAVFTIGGVTESESGDNPSSKSSSNLNLSLPPHPLEAERSVSVTELHELLSPTRIEVQPPSLAPPSPTRRHTSDPDLSMTLGDEALASPSEKPGGLQLPTATRRRANTLTGRNSTHFENIELSGDLQELVRQGTLKRYLGGEHFEKAAITIQRFYRHHKLRTRFRDVVRRGLANSHSPAATVRTLTLTGSLHSSLSTSHESLPMVVDITPMSARPSMATALSPFLPSAGDTSSLVDNVSLTDNVSLADSDDDSSPSPHRSQAGDEDRGLVRSPSGSSLASQSSEALGAATESTDSGAASPVPAKSAGVSPSSSTNLSASNSRPTMCQRLLAQLRPLSFGPGHTLAVSSPGSDSSFDSFRSSGSGGSFDSSTDASETSSLSVEGGLSTPRTSKGSGTVAPGTPAPSVPGQIDISHRTVSEDHAKTRQVRIAIHKFNCDSKKGMLYLIDKGFVLEKPRHVAFFLMRQPGLSKAMIGEYLGENKEFNLQVLDCFSSMVEMSGKTFDEALRAYLSSFRLPGEAQKIDRMMNTFAQRYTQANPEAFATVDAAYVLAYSTVMLNTDVHNPSVKHKMTQSDFVKNNRGINNNADFPRVFLEGIYDRIASNEILAGEDHVKEVERIAGNIVGNVPLLAIPQRHFVRMANFVEVLDVSQRIPKGKHIRTLYLFNDMLLITKPSRSTLTVPAHQIAPKPADKQAKGAPAPAPSSSAAHASNAVRTVSVPRFLFRNSFPLLGLQIRLMTPTKYHNELFELQDFHGTPLILLKAEKPQEKLDFLSVLQDMIEENAEIDAERLAEMEKALVTKSPSSSSTHNAPFSTSSSPHGSSNALVDSDLKRAADVRSSKRFRMPFMANNKRTSLGSASTMGLPPPSTTSLAPSTHSETSVSLNDADEKRSIVTSRSGGSLASSVSTESTSSGAASNGSQTRSSEAIATSTAPSPATVQT
ncbi:cytohesin-4, variant [Capsaspora owczarzaki ATCC 30864]|uniref:Cytohesin-4 n=1 Tax=Capsaspora owczarzaki (strain ATCC 30864) TaxID=595528 RepID=E9C1W6_CAPO3|nr:cytohesin-4 [Capsaspora owczarzaki ATCC 30864]XP_011270158.1 cytohesin-4, variant [Capsaspora owczarzaki ATCC 30864]KJE91175.1 cytohesin-4 [Capsaspora owczarzaki ATCC 30864]|eukprot:XP_004349099.1 cytohesin-4 [Capsaspora owczarzaki ATCC 30864]